MQRPGRESKSKQEVKVKLLSQRINEKNTRYL